jgi:hypothetical protein
VFKASLLAGLLLTASPLSAQTTSAATQRSGSSTTWMVRNWTRAEMWRFFEPPPGGGNNDYVYGANRLQAGVRRTTPRYELTGVMQYVQFGGLPADATGPGPLGLGAVYFAHAGRRDSHQVYLRYLNLQVKNILPGLSLQIGRMPYSSGGEAASGIPKIEAVKRQRIDARIVGEFDWSVYQRGFDGARFDLVKPAWSATVVAFNPTQGGFEDAAGLMMPDVPVVGGSAAVKPGRFIPGTEWQVFAFRYVDRRHLSARPDNTGRTADKASIAINSFGTTLVASSPVREGRQWDGLLWLVAQNGSWYEQQHRAVSVAVEAGHQWTDAPWRPWVRGGYLRASGDEDPADDRHGTFFQMLPTVRRYAQTAAYSQMNNTDLFAQAILRPAPALGLRVDVHEIGLASARDHWYFGSGATQARGTTFGYSTRPSNGRTDLGTSTEIGADYTLSPHWSINGFLGVVRGGQVVQRSFSGRMMTFGYLENVVQF